MRNVAKTTFFSFIFPIPLYYTSWPSFSIVLCANQKLQQKTCNTCATLLWPHLRCDTWDVRKFVFHPKKSHQFWFSEHAGIFSIWATSSFFFANAKHLDNIWIWFCVLVVVLYGGQIWTCDIGAFARFATWECCLRSWFWHFFRESWRKCCSQRRWLM